MDEQVKEHLIELTSEKEMSSVEKTLQKQLDELREMNDTIQKIKGWVTFFGVLAVISLIAGVIIAFKIL